MALHKYYVGFSICFTNTVPACYDYGANYWSNSMTFHIIQRLNLEYTLREQVGVFY